MNQATTASVDGVDDRPSACKGRDSVTDAMDAYLLNGMEAVKAWTGRSNRVLVAAYMQGCAAIHAAEIAKERDAA